VAAFAGLIAVKARVPDTAPELATERVTVVPEISVTVAPVPIPAPDTDIPIPRNRELSTVIVVAPFEPVAALVALGSNEKKTVELTAPVFARVRVRTLPEMLRIVAPVAIFAPDTPIPTVSAVLFGTVIVNAPDEPMVVSLLEQANGVISLLML
jgi:hypothetical protein